MVLLTFLTGLQERYGVAGACGWLWIFGYSYAMIAAELTEPGMGWSPKTVQNAMKLLKRRGQVIVFKNKRHRGCARIRVVPIRARSRVAHAFRLKSIARLAARRQAAAAAPETGFSPVVAVPDRVAIGRPVEKVRRQIFAVPVETQSLRLLTDLRLRPGSEPIAPAEGGDAEALPAPVERAASMRPDDDGGPAKRLGVADPPVKGPAPENAASDAEFTANIRRMRDFAAQLERRHEPPRGRGS